MNMDAVGIVKRETIPRTPNGVRIPSRPAIPTEPGRPNGLPRTSGGSGDMPVPSQYSGSACSRRTVGGNSKARRRSRANRTPHPRSCPCIRLHPVAMVREIPEEEIRAIHPDGIFGGTCTHCIARPVCVTDSLRFNCWRIRLSTRS